MKTPSKNRSLLHAGGLYRNRTVQVREILSIERGVVTFRVIDPGPDGDHTFNRLLMDRPYQNQAKGFEEWAYQEVTR
jgi:hypothetical protein